MPSLKADIQRTDDNLADRSKKYFYPRLLVASMLKALGLQIFNNLALAYLGNPCSGALCLPKLSAYFCAYPLTVQPFRKPSHEPYFLFFDLSGIRYRRAFGLRQHE